MVSTIRIRGNKAEVNGRWVIAPQIIQVALNGAVHDDERCP